MYRRSATMRQSMEEGPVRMSTRISPQPQSRSSSTSGPSAGKKSLYQSKIPAPHLNSQPMGENRGKRSLSAAGRSSSTVMGGGGGGPRERNTNRPSSSSSSTTPSMAKRSLSVNAARSTERKSKQNSDFLTPVRMSYRKSVMSTDRRQTTGGSRLSGRGSNIGAKSVKDTRPLTDKQYQQSQIRKILDFLRENHYSNTTLTSRHFPLASKEFVDVFNFLYSFLNELDTNVLPSSRGEEVVVKVMKDYLHYPGNITKSNFITMGSLHSWPTVLGCLAYLNHLAMWQWRALTDAVIIGFPEKDENGFHVERESKNLILASTMIQCYIKFNEGADEFGKEMSTFRDELIQYNNLDVAKLKKLQQQKDGILDKVKSMREQPDQVREKREKLKLVVEDKNKLTDYLSKMNLKKEDMKRKLDLLKLKEEEARAREESIEQNFQGQVETSNRDNVSQLEMERKNQLEAELRRKIGNLRDRIASEDQLSWQEEIGASKGAEEMEKNVKEFNSVCLQAGLTIGGEPMVLSLPIRRDGSLVRNPMRDTLWTGLKELQRETLDTLMKEEWRLATLEKEKNERKEAINYNNGKWTSLEEKVESVNTAVQKLKEVGDQEIALLDRNIATYKTKLHEVRTRDHASRQQLEEQLETVNRRLEELQQERDVKREKNKNFLLQAKEKAEKYKEKMCQLRETKVAELQSAIALKKDMLTRLEEIVNKNQIDVDRIVQELQKKTEDGD